MGKQRVQFNVRLDGKQDLVLAVKTYVANHGLTMSEFVATALENALQTGVKPKANQLAIPNEDLQGLSHMVNHHDEQIAKVNQRLANVEERLVKLRRQRTVA